MRIVYGASEDFRLSTSAAQDTQCLVPPGRSISARGRFVGDSLGDPRHYSTDYLLLQGIVCVVFLADFFARMWMADHSWRFFFRNLYFFLLSVPYLNIVDWMGIELSHAEAMLMGLVPLLRALLGAVCAFHLDHQ